MLHLSDGVTEDETELRPAEGLRGTDDYCKLPKYDNKIIKSFIDL